MDVGNLISGSSAFSKTSLNNWKFTVHVLLKPGLENFEPYFTNVWLPLMSCITMIPLQSLLTAGLWEARVALVIKNQFASTGDLREVGSVPGSERSPGGEHGNPFQYSCLENSMGRGAWRATVHRVQRVRQDWRDLAHTHIRSPNETYWNTKQLISVNTQNCEIWQMVVLASHWLQSDLLPRNRRLDPFFLCSHCPILLWVLPIITSQVDKLWSKSSLRIYF